MTEMAVILGDRLASMRGMLLVCNLLLRLEDYRVILNTFRIYN